VVDMTVMNGSVRSHIMLNVLDSSL